MKKNDAFMFRLESSASVYFGYFHLCLEVAFTASPATIPPHYVIARLQCECV